MQTIRHHQHDFVAFGRAHDLFALLRGHRQRFFTKYMNTGLRGTHSVVAVQAVRQRDVHGIDRLARETLVILLIRIKSRRLVFAPELRELFLVA